MTKIAIIFGTDTGNTRRIAKQIAKLLGPERCHTPINIAKLNPDEFMSYDHFILGTPTYGDGVLPGLGTGTLQPSWAEFVAYLKDANLSDKRIAIYGLGDQKKYDKSFVDGIYQLYQPLTEAGAEIIGHWLNEEYQFTSSAACIDGKFVGLPLDQDNQKELTDARVQRWVDQLLKQGMGQMALS